MAFGRAMLRAAAACGRAARRGLSSSGAQASLPKPQPQPHHLLRGGGGVVQSRSYHHLPNNNTQVGPSLLEKFNETRMNVAKGNLLIDCLQGLTKDRKKMSVTRNSTDLWTVFAFSSFFFVLGNFVGNDKALSDKSSQHENGDKSLKVA